MGRLKRLFTITLVIVFAFTMVIPAQTFAEESTDEYYEEHEEWNEECDEEEWEEEYEECDEEEWEEEYEECDEEEWDQENDECDEEEWEEYEAYIRLDEMEVRVRVINKEIDRIEEQIIIANRTNDYIRKIDLHENLKSKYIDRYEEFVHYYNNNYNELKRINGHLLEEIKEEKSNMKRKISELEDEISELEQEYANSKLEENEEYEEWEGDEEHDNYYEDRDDKEFEEQEECDDDYEECDEEELEENEAYIRLEEMEVRVRVINKEIDRIEEQITIANRTNDYDRKIDLHENLKSKYIDRYEEFVHYFNNNYIELKRIDLHLLEDIEEEMLKMKRKISEIEDEISELEERYVDSRLEGNESDQYEEVEEQISSDLYDSKREMFNKAKEEFEKIMEDAYEKYLLYKEQLDYISNEDYHEEIKEISESIKSELQRLNNIYNERKNEILIENVYEEVKELEEELDKEQAISHVKEQIHEARNIIKHQRNLVQEELDIIREELRSAKEDEDIDKISELEDIIFEQELKLNKIIEEKKENLEKLKEIVIQRYSEEELEHIEYIRDEIIEKNEDLFVLPINAIVSGNFDFDFDVPPVVKEGTTFVSINSISKAFDAEIKYSDDGKVIIIIPEKEVVISIDQSLHNIDGEITETDLEIQTDGTTLVPLRAIVEDLGLTIHWDEQTNTIEIEELEVVDN